MFRIDPIDCCLQKYELERMVAKMEWLAINRMSNMKTNKLNTALMIQRWHVTRWAAGGENSCSVVLKQHVNRPRKKLQVLVFNTHNLKVLIIQCIKYLTVLWCFILWTCWGPLMSNDCIVHFQEFAPSLHPSSTTNTSWTREKVIRWLLFVYEEALKEQSGSATPSWSEACSGQTLCISFQKQWLW